MEDGGWRRRGREAFAMQKRDSVDLDWDLDWDWTVEGAASTR